MKTRIGFSLILVGICVMLYNYQYYLFGPISGSAAVGQLQDSKMAYIQSKMLMNFDGSSLIAMFVILLILIWSKPLFRIFRSNPTSLAILFIMGMFLTGCSRLPYNEPKFIDIQPNQTAFVIPLEGASKDDQGKFMSVDFLNENKVAKKRIEIGRKWIQTSNQVLFFAPDGYYQDTATVVLVDRTPVTREWTKSKDNGTDTRDQAIYVESKESIDFHTGATISAVIREEDAAKFLYWYAGKNLNEIIDSNVRGEVQAILTSEFGSRTLDDCRNNKSAIMNTAFAKIKADFLDKGITIINFGGSGGLDYDDPNIQAAINNAFVAQNNKQVQIANREAQDEVNKNTVNMALANANAGKAAQDIANQQAIETAKANSTVAEEFARTLEARKAKNEIEVRTMRAEAMLELAKHSTGLPKSILPAGSQLLMGLDSPQQ